jgi:MYXO-CTERM domain-containing protein
MSKYLCRGILCSFLVVAAVGCEPADSPEIKALEQAAKAGGYDPAHPLLTNTDGGTGGPEAGVRDLSVRVYDLSVGTPKSSDCSYPGAAPNGSGLAGLALLVGGLLVFRRRRS